MNLRLFVYGTLKRGGPAHAAYCMGALEIVPASIRGRVVQLDAGYPALVVDAGDVLALAGASAAQDLLVQEQVLAKDRREGEHVAGEILVFADATARLPALDLYEATARGAETLYRRVLTTAWTPSGLASTVWTYALAP